MQAAVGLPTPPLSSFQRGDPPSTGLWGTLTAVYGSPEMKLDTFVNCIVFIQLNGLAGVQSFLTLM